ncbi:hypothetical protein, partial [Palleronia caenipelagi]
MSFDPYDPSPPSHFPPISPAARRLEHPVRRLAEGLSEEDRCVLYANLSRSHPDYRPCDFSLGHTRVTVTQDSETLVFPRPLPLVKHLLCASGYLRWLHRKYTLPGFVEITPGDRVLDCGAYVG